MWGNDGESAKRKFNHLHVRWRFADVNHLREQPPLPVKERRAIDEEG
jgi:hypothetical protein